MKRVLAIMLTVTLLLGSLAGCGGAAEEDNNAPDGDAGAGASADGQAAGGDAGAPDGGIDLSQYTIGMSMHFMMDDWAKIYVETFERICNERGINFEMTDGNNDPEKQLNDLMAFRDIGVDAVAMLPLDAGALAAICDDFAAAGIPVIATADISDTAPITCYSDGGQWDKGNAAGEALAAALDGTGKVVIMTQPSLSVQLDERIAGFTAAIEGTGIEVVDTKLATTSEEAMNVVNDLITSGVEVDAIWCSLGTLMIGAGEALKARGDNSIMVFGVDADYSILQLIKEGYITGATAQYPSATAENIVDIIVRIWEGEELSGAVIESGTRDVVTIDNVEEMCVRIWNRELE